MSIASTVLMCHAPIVIPVVAGRRAALVQKSTMAMQEVANHIVSVKPDFLVVVSPHTPRIENFFGLLSGPKLEGDLSGFGFPELKVELPSDNIRGHLLDCVSKSAGAKLLSLPRMPLDHGALVPLFFMHMAGWRGQTAVVSLPFSPTAEECLAMGEVITAASERASERQRRWAVIASGDMSHRLTQSSPAGYHKRAHEFDEFFRDRIRAGKFHEAINVDPELRELAGEDVVDSVAVAAASVGFEAVGNKVLSYEGPFGVGYLVAVLNTDERMHERTKSS
ncbi:MAG: class III extradiol dioxygenase subunit B-like domain-containing protein [Bdellovibrionota bacterium]